MQIYLGLMHTAWLCDEYIHLAAHEPITASSMQIIPHFAQTIAENITHLITFWYDTGQDLEIMLRGMCWQSNFQLIYQFFMKTQFV